MEVLRAHPALFFRLDAAAFALPPFRAISERISGVRLAARALPATDARFAGVRVRISTGRLKRLVELAGCDPHDVDGTLGGACWSPLFLRSSWHVTLQSTNAARVRARNQGLK